MPIKVLVVDDSSFMRKMISDILDSEPGIEVIDRARNGLEALEKIKKLKPDVITLDIKMPDMSGLDVLDEVMEKIPTPTIILSAYAKEGSQESVLAFEYGAVEVIPKPSGEISLDIKSISEKLIKAVTIAAEVDINQILKKRVKKTVKAPSTSHKEILVIGASTGGPQAIAHIISSLPENFPVPVVIVQHMPGEFTKTFAKRLDKHSQIQVKEAEQGERLEKGMAYVVPGDYSLEVEKKALNRYVKLKKTIRTKKSQLSPNINTTIISVAEIYGRKAIAVILTGMGDDGAKGSMLLKRAGGTIIAQNKQTCAVYGMPKEVIENKDVDCISSLDKISNKIAELLWFFHH